MFRKSSTVFGLSILFALAAAFAAPSPAIAQADCTAWDVSNGWVAVQGSYRVSFQLNQSGNSVQGEGTFSTKPDKNLLGMVTTFGTNSTAPVSGTIKGKSLELNTAWGGVYLGRIDSTGRIDGTTYDKGNSTSRANWYSDRRMNCLARASDTPPPPSARAEPPKTV